MEIADDYQQPGSQRVAVSETEANKTALKKVPGAGEVIIDDEKAKGEVVISAEMEDVCRMCSCA